MEIQQDWDKSKLSDYLLGDYWQPNQAFFILAGFDCFWDSRMGSSLVLLDHMAFMNAAKVGDDGGLRAELALTDGELQVDRLRDFWHAGSPRNLSHFENHETPAFFIEWALSKRFRPDWLDWAIERDLYIPKQGTANHIATADISESGIDTIFDKASPNYPPELDAALQAWRAVTATEGKGKPKARIKVWLDENAKEFDLSDEAKKRIATVANWDKKGGATRTN